MESLPSMLLAMQVEQEGLSCWDRPFELTRENLLSGVVHIHALWIQSGYHVGICLCQQGVL